MLEKNKKQKNRKTELRLKEKNHKLEIGPET